jgi:hypothetical protein
MLWWPIRVLIGGKREGIGPTSSSHGCPEAPSGICVGQIQRMSTVTNRPDRGWRTLPDDVRLEESGTQRRRFAPAPAPPPPRDIITPRMKPKSYQFPLLTTS